MSTLTTTTISTVAVGDGRSDGPSATRRMWLLTVVFVAVSMVVLVVFAAAAGRAQAAPALHLDLSHSTAQINRGDEDLAYTATLRNDAPLSSSVPVGTRLTCDSNVWTGTPAPIFTHAWYRNGAVIVGQSASTYTTVAADAGTQVQCVVTGTNADAAGSAATAPISVGAPPTMAPPAPTDVTGNPSRPGIALNPSATVGSTMTCNAPSSWTGDPTWTFRWLRNGAPATGPTTTPTATTSTYVVQPGDVPGGLQCEVIGTNVGGAAVMIGQNRSTMPGPSTPPVNRAADAPTITTDAATSGPLTVSFSLPSGVTAGSLSGTGWTCDRTTASCTRNDPLKPQAAYPSISLDLWLDDDAPDMVTVAATASGGGAADAGASDSFTFGPRLLFGLTNFTAGAFDDAGADLTQAGAHPVTARTAFSIATRTMPGGGINPVEAARRISVNLPPGFVGNPQAVPTSCASTVLVLQSRCPDESVVGGVAVGLNMTPSNPNPPTQPMTVYSIVPEDGQTAEFAFAVPNAALFVLRGEVRSNGDYGLTVTSPLTPTVPQLYSADFTFCGYGGTQTGTPGINSVFGGCKHPGDANANPVPFLTNLTQCTGQRPVTTLDMTSYEHPDTVVSATATTPPIIGCEHLPFSPSVEIDPTVTSPDKPTGLDVKMHFPQDGLLKPDGLATAQLKKAVVSLPEGLTINPAAAGGLEACPDDQLKLHSLDPMKCPDAAKIGTATATTPLLEETLTGSVYMRTQNSMDPESGEMFRIALVLENKERGISVRLPGEVRADAKTGRLTATFDNNPRLPVDDIKLQFKAGSRAPLATPKVCGAHTIGTDLTPWSAPYTTDAVSSSRFTIGCTSGLGWFGPYFTAGTVSPVAGASAPFVLRVSKPDGQSDLNGIALSLPEGLLASLKGNIGRQIGTASVGAGPGATPFWLSGPVVLEGPYGDAPFSLRVTVPVIAGPFNLGDVVVRQKIYVDPHDAHVTVVSDPLPTIVKGVPVRLQNLQVNVDKAGFMRNPTSCAPKSIGGTLGADTGQTAAVASRFQVGACANLPLRPKMQMALKGSKQIKRGKHPTLSTTLTQMAGQSNLKSVKVRLPLSLALDPDNAQALCKPEQAAAKACPKGSIVGHATAISPVLNQPLTGDVFFVEGTRKSKQGRTVKTLPKLWVALRGEVTIDVWADSSISDGKYLVTTFGFVPDAPISSFKLDINGGDHGILAVTGDSDANLCKQRLITNANYVGQNGKQVESKVHMDSPCGFKVRSKSVSISHARVTVSGIGAGRLTISGKGIHKTKRTIKHSKVATLKPRLTAAGKRLYKGRKAIRLRVSFNPKAKGQKTKHDSVVVKRAKKASSSTRSSRMR